jgi:hypothetical protein
MQSGKEMNQGVSTMKKIFYIIILLLGFMNCSMQEHEYESEGIITGIDDRECSCCGGYFIEISDSTYRFDTIPPGSNLKLQNADFPISVKLDWHEDPNACLGDEIIVERIEAQ